MNDEKKTKAQLIKELKSLRKQLDEKAKPKSAAKSRIESNKAVKDYLEMIVKISRDGIAILDDEGLIEFGNRALFKLLGWPKKEVINSSFYKFVPDDQHDFISQQWDELRTGESRSHENIVLTKKGKRKILLASSKDVTIVGQKKYCVMLQDITDHKQAEEALKVSAARLELATAATRIGHWDWDLRTDEVYFSPEWKHQLGYENDEIPNQFETWKSRLHPDDLQRTIKSVEDYIAGCAKDYAVEFRLRHKDGSYRWIYTRGEKQFDDTGKPSRLFGCHVDITEIKQTQQDLKTLMDNTPAAVYRCLNDGNMTLDFVSEQVRQLTGYPASDFLSGKIKWSDLHMPEDLPKIEKVIAGISSKKNKYSMEFRIKTSTGKVKWVMERSLNVYDDSGRLDYVEGFAVDITDSKNVQLALQESEARFRALFEQAAVGVAQINTRTGQFIQINQKYCDIVGYKRHEMEALTFQKITHPEDLRADLDNMNELVKGNIREFSMDKRYFHKNGSVVWVTLTVSPLWKQGQPPDYHIAVVEDITKRKAIAEQLREGEKNYARLIETMSDGLGAVDPNGIITFVNKAFKDILGYSEKNAIGKHVSILFDEEGLKRYKKQLLEREKGAAKTYYADLRHVDGHMVPVVVRPAVIFDDDGNFKGSFGVFTDLTGQKKIRSELERSEKRHKLLYETSQDAIMILDPEQGFTSVNPATVKLFGFKDEQELLFKGPVDISPEFQPDGESSIVKAEKIIEKTFKDGSCFFEWQHRRPDGSEFLGTVLLVAMELQGKKVLYATTRDITEQRRAQEAIKNQLDFENLITEVSTSFINLPVERTDTGINIALGILSKFLKIDRSSVVLFSDDRSIADVVYEWCGKDIPSRRQEVKDLSIMKFRWWITRLKKGKPIYMHSLDEFPKSAATEKEFFAAAHIKSYVTVPIFFNKELIGFMNFYSVKKAKIWDTETISLLKIVAEIFVNTIMRSRSQRELREYDAKMFRTEQLASLGIISANIAHELNQPLTVIQLLLQQVKRSLTKKPGDIDMVRENINDSLSELTRAAEIVARFRTFARQSSPGNIEMVDICKVAESLVKALSSGARKTLLKLSLKKPRKAVYVRATTADIEQLFFVLIQNSIQASRPKAKNHLNINISYKKNNILLDFKDNCGGVPKELAEKIFEPFFTTKPRQKGTGLGLPILERIVKRYEGVIKYENHPGHGIFFHICLPMDG